MSLQDPIWLASEFYIATNTFCNPIFEDFAPNQVDQEEEHQQEANEYARHSNHRTLKDGLNQFYWSTRHSCSQLCDNLKYSLRAKLFVMELNFKKKLRVAKQFATKRFPWIGTHRTKAYYKDSRNNQKYYYTTDCTLDNSRKFWTEVDLTNIDNFNDLHLKREKILQRLQPHVIRTNKAMQDPNHRTPEQTANIQLRPGVLRDENGFVNLWPYATSQKRKTASSSVGHANYAKSRENNRQKRANKVCIVCYTNEPNIVTLPCRHQEVCSDCLAVLIYFAIQKSQFPLKCVLCRQKVAKIHDESNKTTTGSGWNRMFKSNSNIST